MVKYYFEHFGFTDDISSRAFLNTLVCGITVFNELYVDYYD